MPRALWGQAVPPGRPNPSCRPTPSAARAGLVSLYRHWGWHVGAPAAGLGVQIGTDAVLINEKPVRTVWLPLVPEVRPSLTVVPGALVVTGIFD
ncbi:hypothetical protein [Streptomyces erythrochromogenes]|uniref:hypothetical protein n=1 Tax=Streptomyces erythrochromogenes TaxID=285574 RepID=UPI0036FF43DD